MDATAMLSELNDHGFADTGTSRKVGALNDAYYDICSRESWPFLEKATTVSFTASDSSPTLPVDFSKVITLTIPNTSMLSHERLDVMSKMVDLALTGVPYLYYFVGNELRVWPVPDTSYTGTLFYICAPTALTEASTENAILLPVRHHRTIVVGALTKLYAMEDDLELSQAFQLQFEQRIQTMREDLWKRQYDTPDRVHLTSLDEFNYFD